MNKELINLSNLQRFLSKLSEKFALKKAMKGISEDAEGNIIIGEEGLVPTPNENSKGKFLRSDGEWALPSETAVYDSMTLEEGVAGVSKVDRVINAKNLKQIVNSDGFLTSLDSSKLTGVINIENLPQGALERILIVSSKEERLTLLDTEVQLGDVVKESDTGLMYYVINTEKLNSEEGYTQFTAGSASSVPWSGVTDKPTIPTKTSDLTNDSNFAVDSDVVHTSGNETINGIKTFSNTTISNKELHYKDIKYDWSDKSLNTWCDAGHVVWFDKTGNRRMHELVGANGGIWKKSCYINENQYFSVDSNKNISYAGISFKFNGKNVALDENLVHRTGNETINGVKTFTSDIYFKNNYIDLTVTPPSNLYSNFIFTDKNNQVVSYIQYAKTTNDDVIGLFVKDADQGLHGIQVTSEDNVKPLGNGVVNLGLSGAKWKNVYATTFNGNLKGNADSSTKASYLDNYSLPGGNKIYLDWSGQKKDYVGLKVDNTLMGGLITTNNIGSQSVNSATYATSAGSAAKATQDSVGQQINKTYIKELSVSGRTITYKRGDNTTGTITTQDTNTTYSKLSQFTNDTGFITSSGSCNYSNSAGNGIDSSGANYVKFKDGTQICFGANKGGDIVTFANAFRSTPIIAFGYNIGSDVDRVIHGQAKYSSSTSFTMQVWDFKSNTWSNERVAEWIAIGHWK